MQRVNLYSAYVPKKLAQKFDFSDISILPPSVQAEIVASVSEDCVFNPRFQYMVKKFHNDFDIKKRKPVQYALKRAMDYAFASTGIILGAPVMGLSALAIKMESKGPVFFKQKRIGKGGKIFEIYKYRTMGVNNPNKNALLINGAKDPQITRVGRLLRKYSLDELPQLFNILKGDMSLVGPRPNYIGALEDDLISISKNYLKRYTVRPGCGLGYKAAKEGDLLNRISTDECYVSDWSLKKDFHALFGLVKKIVTGDNY